MPRVVASGRVVGSGRLSREDNYEYHTMPAWEWLAAMPEHRVSWWAKDADSLLLRATNPYIAEGRDLVLNGGMAGGTISPWTGTNWAYNAANGGVARHTPGASTNLQQTALMVIGKAYKLTYTILNMTTGNLTDLGGNVRTANNTHTIYFIATGTPLTFNPSSTFDGDIDDVSLKQVNIRPSTDYDRINGRLQLATNGQFNFDYAWALGSGVSISGGQLVFNTVASNVGATQTPSIVTGKSYDVTFTVVSVSAGGVKCSVGNTADGTTQTVPGTYTQTLVCAGNNTFYIRAGASGFTGVVDNVIITPSDEKLVFNGDGSTATGWSVAAAAVLSSVAGWLRVTNGGTANPAATQSCAITGRRYRIRVTARGDGTAAPVVFIGSTSVTGTSSTSPQTFDFAAVKSSATITLRASGGTNGNYCEFQSVVLTEINPLDAVISGAVPVSGEPVPLGGTALSFDGVNDFANLNIHELNSLFTPEQFWWLTVAQTPTPLDGVTRYMSRIGNGSGVNDMRLYFISTGFVHSFYAGGGVGLNQIFTNFAGNINPFLLDTFINIAGSEQSSAWNGVEYDSDPAPLLLTGAITTSISAIGASTNSTGANPWNGKVYGVCLLNKNPSDAERLQLAKKLGLN